jgi:acetoacetyl-CoA synthetase
MANIPHLLWTPSQERVKEANLTTFMNAVLGQLGIDISSYADLHAWSVKDIAAFWSFYADYAGFKFGDVPTLQGAMPYTIWFEGATLNYAEQLLYPKHLKSDEQTAIISVTETGFERKLSYKQLREEVAHCVGALKAEGIEAGDRVAAFACNVPETVILFLACASIGAIFSSCSPDFGFEAAFARFSQIKPKLLFASPLYHYGAKKFDTLATVGLLEEKITSLQKVVILPPPPNETISYAVLKKAEHWRNWLELRRVANDFKPLPFDHPLYILYSSGTTGLPKAMVHRAGGALLQHHKEHHLHCDIKPGDVVLYFSTCGWMMWNWLVSVLAQAATIVLYEGSPAQPNSNILWSLAEKHRITFFGTSARYLHTLQSQNFSTKGLDLSSLRTIASTGSPLSPSAFEYVYQNLKADVHLASISGGTDIVSCFMLGVPTESVYDGYVQGAGLGVDLAVFDETGNAVKNQAGELVCRQPLPSMPLKFWNDEDFQKYKAAYFEVYPGVWRHGDLIEQTEHGLLVYGRSDATLNPGGVRIGTAEIYRPLEPLTDIIEACAVGKKLADDEEIWLFVVLQEGITLTPELSNTIKTEIRQKASPRHVPKNIFQVSQLPRTRSGKSMEIAVSKLINGQQVSNREVMANPEVLEEITSVISRI